jgi:hypothetical protein
VPGRLLTLSRSIWRAAQNAIGWAIYAAGFVIWLFGYVTAGHAAVFDWDAATPSWISEA